MAIGIAVIRVDGHHSFAATYDESKKVEVSGQILSFSYRNPHSVVSVEAPGVDGAAARWAVEWGAAAQLLRQGVLRETLKTGDLVVITGNPGRRAADNKLRLLTISRPADGWTWNGTFD
jgi:hypothetical protein